MSNAEFEVMFQDLNKRATASLPLHLRLLSWFVAQVNRFAARMGV
jgi:hypothetical protein